MMRLACLLAPALALAGCGLYSNPPPPPICNAGAAGIAQQTMRDPSTGQCEAVGGTCDPQCGPCPATGAAGLIPDWASCSGPCEGLGEQACLATAGCHAAYLDNSAATPDFWGCWDMPPSGPIEGGACAGLDAQTCSEHDDCASLYTGPVNSGPNYTPSYESCVSENPLPPPPPPPACSTLTTESDCVARTDCEPIYDGQNCTCDPNGCTCQIETYSHCQAR